MITFETAQPDNIKMTLHVTLEMGEWKKLRDCIKKSGLQGQSPMYYLCSQIEDLTDRAEHHFYEKVK